MIATSQRRRPSLSPRPRPNKGRRVSFAELSDDESSHKVLPVESGRSEAGCHPAPIPYDSTRLRSPDIGGYTLRMAPPMSCTNGGTSPTNCFLGQPLIPPGPYWVSRKPQFGDHPLGFETFTDVLGEEEDGEHGNEQLPSLRNLCIAVLVAAVVTVVVFIAVTVDLPAAIYQPETSPPPYRMSMGNRKIVASLEATKDLLIVTRRPAIPAATQTPVKAQPGARTRQPHLRQRAQNRTVGHTAVGSAGQNF